MDSRARSCSSRLASSRCRSPKRSTSTRKARNLTVVPLYGGAPMDHQIRALRRGAEVIVATPGRALDHLRRTTLNLSKVEVLVLDEADEMLDMGFAEDIDAIIAQTPETRQTALFAATMAPRILAIAGRHLKKPTKVQIAQEKRAPGKVPRVRQVAYIVGRRQKIDALGRILDFESAKSAIVFCRTRIEVDELTDTLERARVCRPGAARRHDAEAARSRDAAVSRREGGDPRRHGRGRARSRHRARVARDQLRSPVGARGLHPSHRPHRPDRPRGRRDHARRTARAAVPAIRGTPDETEDRDRPAAE